MDILFDLLESLQTYIAKPYPNADEVKEALDELLVWLVENNSDENCRRVDLFVLMNIEDKEKAKLPESIQEILYDIGGSLHDTHTAPDVARNFASTPEQLLERIRKL